MAKAGQSRDFSIFAGHYTHTCSGYNRHKQMVLLAIIIVDSGGSEDRRDHSKELIVAHWLYSQKKKVLMRWLVDFSACSATVYRSLAKMLKMQDKTKGSVGIKYAV